MTDVLDDRLRRKLVARRGRLHAFPDPVPTRSAVVVIDATESFVRGLPDSAAACAAIDRLTGAARSARTVVHWIHPTPPATWLAAAAATALLGTAQVARHAREMAAGGPGARIDPSLNVAPTDRHAGKRGYSAFFPGAGPLPAELAGAGIDTVILAGFLTDTCVEASARDAFESGFRVILCADGCAANDPACHRHSLRRLARAYADVRPAAEIAGLLGAGRS